MRFFCFKKPLNYPEYYKRATYFRVAKTLSSALRDFTSEFGMGSGGALSAWPPYNSHDY